MVANWKSHKSRDEAVHYMDDLQDAISTYVATDALKYRAVICPPASLLMYVSNRLLDRVAFADVTLGVQDLSPYPSGAYTGALSTRNLDGFGVRYAILGHSERRRYFAETSAMVAQKVEQALEGGITPIVCVDADEIAEQATALDDEHKQRIIVAYEPHEYIGTGVTQGVDEILQEVARIKDVFGDVQVLYGASVNPETMRELTGHDEIAGFLVGSASLDAKMFAQMLV